MDIWGNREAISLIPAHKAVATKEGTRATTNRPKNYEGEKENANKLTIRSNIIASPRKAKSLDLKADFSECPRITSPAIEKGQYGSNNDGCEYWKHMFEALREERVTNVEKLLQATLEENVRRDKALRDMVQHLEKETSRQKQRAQLAEHKLEAFQTEQDKLITSHKEEVERLLKEANINEILKSNKRRDRESELEHDLSHERQKAQKLSMELQSQNTLLDFYQMLTSTRVTVHNAETKTPSFDCTFVNFAEQKAAQVRLALVPPSKDELKRKVATDDKLSILALQGEMTCMPLANPHYLPEFMRDRAPIEFERTQCPVLLKSVLNAMFKDE